MANRVTGHLYTKDTREGPVWYIRSRVPERKPEETRRRLAPAHLGPGKPPVGALTRKQADEALARYLVAERQKVGDHFYRRQVEMTTGATFADASAAFLRHIEFVKGREAATVSDYRYCIEGYLDPRWGNWPLAAIRPADVAELRDDLLRPYREPRPLSPRTVVHHLTIAHSVFKFATREFGLVTNPAAADLVDRPSVHYSGDFVTLDAGDLAALARAAADPQDAALYLTAAYTGLRQGELLALRWGDIDFASQRVHVRRAWSQAAKAEKVPKSRKVRSVPLIEELLVQLDRLSRREHFTGDEDLVFCTTLGKHLDAWALRKRYSAALEAAGLPRVRFHDLRHCFGSTAVREFPLSDVQAMLGHAHITTTMRYVHHRPGADDAARLSAAFRQSADDLVSRAVSRNDDFGCNSEQVSASKSR